MKRRSDTAETNRPPAVSAVLLSKMGEMREDAPRGGVCLIKVHGGSSAPPRHGISPHSRRDAATHRSKVTLARQRHRDPRTGTGASTDQPVPLAPVLGATPQPIRVRLKDKEYHITQTSKGH